jgi:hypothetical protein
VALPKCTTFDARRGPSSPLSLFAPIGKPRSEGCFHTLGSASVPLPARAQGGPGCACLAIALVHAAQGRTAMAAISTFTSRGRRATSTVARAGGALLKKVA